MNEIWKDVEGYEGLYQVSNLGRVRSLKFRKEKILSPGNSKCYLFVVLCKNGEMKHASVHRLVGKAFVDGFFEGAVINHIDHNPKNNVCTNLEWTTQKDNSSREKSFAGELTAIRNKKLLTNGILSKKILQFTKSGTFVQEWPSLMEIKRQLRFSPGNICKCCNGNRKSAYGYIWRYA